MQEAIDLKGWTASLDLTIPVNETMQFRFEIPVRTEAEGVLLRTENPIDIEGWAGIYENIAMHFEHQLVGGEVEPGNFSYYFGIGSRAATLETGTGDQFIHQARTYYMGARYDYRAESGSSAYFLDAGLRTYAVSDDLNPNSSRGDKFNLGIFRAGWFRPGLSFTPGVEVVADIGYDYTNISLVPELIWHGNDMFHAKIGLAVGISPDSPDYGGAIEFSFNF